VVTWNRAELLERSLTAILGQSRPPNHVLVVDNASTDQTPTVLRQRFADQVDVLRLAENLVGVAGFAAGIVRALEHDPDAVWLMDDDPRTTPPWKRCSTRASTIPDRHRLPGQPGRLDRRARSSDEHPAGEAGRPTQ